MDPDMYMAMIVRSNASLCRERVRDEHARGSWDIFERALSCTEPGNQGQLGFYFFVPEITPHVPVPVTARFDRDGRPVSNFSQDDEVRAVVEWQCMSLRVHAENIGVKVFDRIIATGGAAASHGILQVLADVFGADVWVGEQSDSASLGAAIRAKHSWARQQTLRRQLLPFDEVAAGAVPLRKVAVPNPAAYALYNSLLVRFCDMQSELVAASKGLE